MTIMVIVFPKEMRRMRWETMKEMKNKYPNNLPLFNIFDSWIYMVRRSIMNKPVDKIIRDNPTCWKKPPKIAKINPIIVIGEIISNNLTRSFILSIINPAKTIVKKIAKIKVNPRPLNNNSCRLNSKICTTIKFRDIVEKKKHIRK